MIQQFLVIHSVIYKQFLWTLLCYALPDKAYTKINKNSDIFAMIKAQLKKNI
ncbi:hypothetical protein ABWED_0720 [Acinetobacter lwoffii]|nr:hypothetical protein ABWED_0720 [Acinetobacter lwoffii]